MSSRNLLRLTLSLMLALLLSCGNDESGPAGAGGAPTPSVLTADASVVANSITVRWTRCPDTDFDEYRLYRSADPGIEPDPGQATVIATFTSASDTAWIDTGLDWSSDYHYAVLTSDMEGLESWSNEAGATTPDSTGGILTCHDIQGEAGSSPYEGQVVTVAGIVTAGGDEYYSSLSPYAVIGDATGGPWSGLVLYGDSVADLQRGQYVAVTGEVQEYWGLTEISFITGIEVLGSGEPLPDASQVQTVELTDAGGAEQWEGVLVTISDALVDSVAAYGQFTADDGSGPCVLDDMGGYSYVPAVGDTLLSATGILWYGFSEWKLEPRDDADLDVAYGSGSGGVLSCYEVQGQADSSPYAGQVVSVTGIVTAGGGEFYSGSAAYATMADAGGGSWSGLVLYGTSVSGLVRGDSVVVTGEVQEYNGMTELSSISSVQVVSASHPLPAPEILSTGTLSTPADPEQWEGVLVRVQSVTVSNPDLGYGEWSVTDGSGDCRVDDLGDYTYTPQAGDQLSSITGILWYSFDDFKMEPRDGADIME